MMRSEQTVEIHGVTAVVPVDSSATPRRSIPPRLHSRGFLRRRVNLRMKSVSALIVMVLCSSMPSAFAEVLQNSRYGYDATGNIEALTDPLNGHQQFAYDDLDRLQTANGLYGNYTYQYDEIGNLKVNPQVSPNPYTYPASGPSSVRPHAVTTAGANTYTYDANGNMETGAGRTIAWNHENKPLMITQGSTTTTFVYDGDGGRVKKITSTTTISYISKLYECDSAGGCSRFIWAGDQRIATVADNGTVHYWHVDHLGSSSVITDGTGARKETITYYPYGEVRTDTSGTPVVNVPYKYTGQELDSSTGLYYYEARYYDPKLGRFISADTMVPSLLDPEALNRYTYARNNPLRYTDPTGHFINFIPFFIGIAISATVSTVVNVSIAAATGGDLGDAAKAGAITGAITGLCAGKCGPIGGMIAYSAAGAASAAVLGLDPGQAAMSGAMMGLAMAVTPNLAYQPFGNGNFFARYGNQMLNHSVRGAAIGTFSAAISGQNPGYGALRGFATSAAIFHLSLANAGMRNAMIENSKGNPANLSGTSAGLFGDGIKLAGNRFVEGVEKGLQYTDWLGGQQGGQGEFFSVPYAPGSLLDFQMEAFAGPHDYLNSRYWYNKVTGNAINHQGWDRVYGEALSGINVIGAAPFAIGPMIQNQAYPYMAR
jgi:RHS repeat-associated protein